MCVWGEGGVGRAVKSAIEYRMLKLRRARGPNFSPRAGGGGGSPKHLPSVLVLGIIKQNGKISKAYQRSSENYRFFMFMSILTHQGSPEVKFYHFLGY